GAIIRSGVQRTGAGLETGVQGVATDRRVSVASGHGGGESHAPLVCTCPERGDLMHARGTFEEDIQFDLVGRGVQARSREGPLSDSTCDREARLRDGGKGRGGGQSEKG